jgi:DNA topoisomerase-1
MPRLRRADCSGPGISRRRRGRGFSYRDAAGSAVDAGTRRRIDGLAIPPAWTDVWICLDPRGHLQATGVDDAGRRQYLYHPRWREHRDRRKFAEMVSFAEALPTLRRAVERDLRDAQPDRDAVLACAVRLLDRGSFRVGGEDYAAQNGSYGLATLLKSHVAVGRDGTLRFDYPAKSSQRRIQAVCDRDAYAIIAALKRRRGGGPQLLAYRERRRWHDIRSEDINAYLRQRSGQDCSAKDFRTWNATVLAASALAVGAAQAPTASPSARKRIEKQAVAEVAEHLGNTPAVCRGSYIDPRIFDRFASGWTIAPDAVPDAVEAAVLDLLADRRGSDDVVRP